MKERVGCRLDRKLQSAARSGSTLGEAWLYQIGNFQRIRAGRQERVGKKTANIRKFPHGNASPAEPSARAPLIILLCFQFSLPLLCQPN
ncbi:hypothetical protein [Collimonas fungivorans]|uniref:hypothetical protein n=1 Tax=Collimonas fungivorans TaxID=158899 RepID=UPI0011D2685D|nr:hypothetical protein [Collimonas fungivorans]